MNRARGYLQSHGSGSPRLDAELLLAHALGLRRLDLYLQHDRLLDDAELQPYRELVARRARGEPVAYLIGRKEFMGVEFAVSPAVLVPNPDTETLVQQAVATIRAIVEAGNPRPRVADVGTGSGCVAITICLHTPAMVIASDLSEAALQVAVENAARQQVTDRVGFAVSDLLSGLEGSFDLVCANLPYVAESAELPAEVVAQPRIALVGGRHGWELNARLLEQAVGRLVAGGSVLLEADPLTMPELVSRARRQYSRVVVHRDLGGRERVLQAWRS